jgi:multiple sugar transport system permease protein
VPQVGHQRDLTAESSGPAPVPRRAVARRGRRAETGAGLVFLLPAVLVILLLSIFPLILSLYLAFSRLRLVRGGYDISFAGVANFRKLLLGSEQRHFLGVFADLSPLTWLLFLAAVALMAYALWRYLRGHGSTVAGFFSRLLTALIVSIGLYFILASLSSGGRPGTVIVTVIYVAAGLAIQYGIGLLLALLTTQRLPGQRFFRVVFLLPMMITPVGVAYMFWMLADTGKGPLKPIWNLLGLAGTSWVNDPWGARWAVIIGDTWQWTPLMFIVLLAAIEGQSLELVEAALVDGASRWQIFRHITLPQLLPVSLTLILIRMIEGFKIIDLPNVLTNGGPGTATESLTLQAFFAWRTLDLGGAMAIAVSLLVLVMFLAVTMVNLIPRQPAEAA